MGQSSVKNMFHHVRRKNVWRYGERERADFDISLILGYFSWNFLSTMINHEIRWIIEGLLFNLENFETIKSKMKENKNIRNY